MRWHSPLARGCYISRAKHHRDIISWGEQFQTANILIRCRHHFSGSFEPKHQGDFTRSEVFSVRLVLDHVSQINSLPENFWSTDGLDAEKCPCPIDPLCVGRSHWLIRGCHGDEYRSVTMPLNWPGQPGVHASISSAHSYWSYKTTLKPATLPSSSDLQPQTGFSFLSPNSTIPMFDSKTCAVWTRMWTGCGNEGQRRRACVDSCSTHQRAMAHLPFASLQNQNVDDPFHFLSNCRRKRRKTAKKHFDRKSLPWQLRQKGSLSQSPVLGSEGGG